MMINKYHLVFRAARWKTTLLMHYFCGIHRDFKHTNQKIPRVLSTIIQIRHLCQVHINKTCLELLFYEIELNNKLVFLCAGSVVP